MGIRNYPWRNYRRIVMDSHILFIAMYDLPFRYRNHKRYSHHSNRNTDNDIRSERFAKHQRTYDDSRNRFEYTKHRSLRCTDVTGSDGQRSRRNDGRQQRKSYQVQPVHSGRDTSCDGSVGTDDFPDENHCPYRKRIEGEQCIGDTGNSLAAVDDDDEECIYQCRSDGKQYTDRVDGLCTVTLRHDKYTAKGRSDSQPYRPRRDDPQEHHDDGHKNGIKKHQCRSQSGSNVFVRFEKKNTAGRVKQSQGKEYADLLS